MMSGQSAAPSGLLTTGASWWTLVLGSIALIAARWRSIPVAPEDETGFLSRGVLFILGIAVFCALSFVILLGTSAPLVTRLTGNPSQVQTPFYSRTTTPAALLLLLLAGLVPILIFWVEHKVTQRVRSEHPELVLDVLAIHWTPAGGA